MRPGLLEIVLVILVVITIVVIARIARSRRGTASNKESATADNSLTQPRKDTNKVWNFLNKTGIVLIIGGAAALIAAVSLFRTVLQGYLWAFIVFAAGLILMLYSRGKK
jgi:membrane protein implicated in regulation of membrane protease activity